MGQTSSADAKVSVVAATASSEESPPYAAAINAFDGRYDNFWHVNSADTFPKWVQADLGSPQTINRVVTFYYGGYAVQEDGNKARDFQIWVSNNPAFDSGTYIVAASVTGNDSYIRQVSFAPVTGRYVRYVVPAVKGTDPSHYWNANMYEMEIWQSADSDGDGYRSNVDCDDTDPSIYPGAEEVCDGKDNNCNSDVDKGVTITFYQDTDGDGYGNPGVTTQACTAAPPDYVANNRDCDDNDAAINPDATEVCDGKDNNCDGVVPANEADADGDGIRICQGDCNDSDATVYPGAPELCDGKDNNCDSVIPTNEADADGDGVRICQGDCDDSDPAVHPGATEVLYNSKDDDCNSSTPDLSVVINEVAWAGHQGLTSDEWIELYNNTDNPIDLTNWTLSAADVAPSIILSGVIQAHNYFLLERTDENTVYDITADQVYGNDGTSWALENGGEELKLHNTVSGLIDTANGNGGAWPKGTASPNYYSMERVDPTTADTDANWASNNGVIRWGLDADGDPINGTPKHPNSTIVPVANADGPYSGDEGSPITLDGSGSSDPQGKPLIYEWDLDGDGEYDDATGVTSSYTWYDDETSLTIGLKVTNDKGAFDTESTTVTVNNVPPAVDVGNDKTADEGETVFFSATVTDPGDDTLTYDWDFGDGSTHSSDSAPTHIYTDNGDYTVTLTVTDDDGGKGSDTLTVHVGNVAPTATFNAPTEVDEGHDIALSLTDPSDPSSADTTAGFQYAFDCGSGSGYGVWSTTSTASCPTTDDGPVTVKGKIRDKDLAETEYTAAVTVNNVAPTATLSNNGPVDEGSPATVSFSGQADPSSADTAAGFHYSFACDGLEASLASTYVAAGTSSTASCAFDDDGSYTVKGRIFDQDDGYTTYQATVVVNNVDPTAIFAASSPINEGGSSSLSLSAPSDPSSADTAAGFHYSFACDGLEASLASTYVAAGASSMASCAFDDDGSYTVKGRIFDQDDGYTTYQATVVVDNVDPTATLSNDGPVNEGSPVTISFSGQFDPSSADTAAGFHYAYDCNGGSLAGTTYASSGTSASTTCTFNDGAASGTNYTVRARIIDKDDGFTEYTTLVHVNNVPPTVTAPANQSAVVLSPTSFNLGSFSDPGADSPWQVDVDWGDGSSHTIFSVMTAGSLGTQSHIYTTIGTKTVKVKVTDKDGASDAKTFTVQVNPIVTTTTLVISPSSVQYSDRITLTATVSPAAAPGSVKFKINGTSLGTVPVSGGKATLSAVAITNMPANYTVTAYFTSSHPNYTSSNGTAALTVTKEDAQIQYTGDTIAQVGTNLTLRATVWDSAASGYTGLNPETGLSATIGNITKMWIAFAIYPAGSCGSGTPITTKYVQVSDPVIAGDGIGAASTTYASSSEASYCVVARLVAGSGGGTNQWYTALNTEAAGITFYTNTGKFVTGGGWINDPQSGKGTFGFIARYNKNGQPQGQMVYVYRGTYKGVPADYIIKSNSLNALQFVGTTYPMTATLQGKATIQIIRACGGIQLYSDGNATFSATVSDSGRILGINSDKFSLTVYDKNGVLYKKVPTTLLRGGNVVIHLK